MSATAATLPLRTPRERTLYKIALGFSILIWLVVLVSIVGAIYGLLIAAGVAVAHALYLAHVRGNGVRLGPDQLPHLWDKVVSASKKLGLPSPPEAYLVQSGGILNAFATRLLGRRFVVLYSSLVEACERADRGSSLVAAGAPGTLDFVVAHEVGHLAAGHLTWLLLPARIVPLLGPAYSRACEYTADRCGHALVADLETSSRALALLAAGGETAARVNLDAFVDQRRESGGFWMAVYELNAGHPYLPKRVAALREAAAPGSAPSLSRNAAAYPLAPFFGLAAGGAGSSGLMVVMVIGVLAALAVPSFEKYVARAKAAQAEQAALASLDPTASEPAPTIRDGVVTGDRFKWTMKAPGPEWQLVPTAIARKQNPLADRWITRGDLDAHIMVIAERTAGPLDYGAFVDAVVNNARNAMPSFEVLKQGTVGTAGKLLVARAQMGGLKLAYRYGLFVTDDAAYQVVAFAPEKNMAAVEDQIGVALRSFAAPAKD